MKRKKRKSCLVLAIMLVLSMALTACQQEGSSGSSEGESSKDATAKEKVEIDVLLAYTGAITTLNSPGDVVTPYIEAKFNVELKEITQAATSDIPFQEMLAARIAAGNEPDVIIAGNENIAYAVGTGKYGDGLEEYIDKMENLNKYMDQSMWPRFMIDGKKVQIPCVTVNTTTEEYTSDPWNIPFKTWAMWTREDILKACGYEFTPLSEIKEQYIDKGEVPPEEAYAITPAIDTPEKLTEYLQKVKELGMTVGDRELIPISLINWSQFHVGTMFNFGHWCSDDSGDVNGFLGCKGSQEYYKWLNNCYNEGLLDADFLIQKEDQLQQKIASGLVGVGMVIPDESAAQKALIDANPEAVIRYIPWPKAEGYTGSFDIFESAFWRVTVANDFKYKDRLCEMWDWMLSDEGLDLATWGPEESGIWEYDENGVKKFTDPDTENACLNGIMGEKGADYYGLYDVTCQSYPFLSTINICSPWLGNYNPVSYSRSYDPVNDASKLNRSYCSVTGYNWDGTASYGDGSTEVAEVSNYYWAEWAGTDCADVITCPKDQFDAVYEEALSEFYDKSEYEDAKARMKTWFEENTAK